jgi:tetratricopeptide (TPR) repeat protein
MSLRIARIALALLAAAAPALAGGTPLERAVEAFQAGKYAVVVEAAPSVAPDSPDHPKLYYLVGESLLLLQRPAEARAAFEQVIAKRPQAVPALVGLGRAQIRSGELDAGAASLKKALELEPKDLQGRVALGELQLRRGEIAVARNTLAEAHAAAPEDVMAAQLYCEALLRAEDPAAAAELAEAYAKRRPEHPLGYFLLAVVMERDGADQEAIEQYQLALSKDETFLDAHKNLAILCHTLSKSYTIRERTLLAYEHYKLYFELGGGDETLRALYDELLRYKDVILGAQ